MQVVETSQCQIHHVSAHVVGNKGNGEELFLSSDVLDISNERLNESLKTYFLSHFQSPEFFTFTFPDEDFDLNPIYKCVGDIFAAPESFHESSVSIASHLYAVSNHPNIKAGDLYVAYLSGLVVENTVTDAIGIFKSENKDRFLKLKKSSGSLSLSADEGTNVRKLDKGCLIFNMDTESGYRVSLVDNANHIDAQFWTRDFLNVTPWSDSFHHTKNFLGFTQQYLTDKMQDEFKVSKADQIDLLNRSVDFFKTRDQFDQREFEMDVLGDANVIESFRKFGSEYREQTDQDIVDNFEISAQAVKRQARIFKSVLKLDKNFHIYIHGSRELIEQGFDEVMGKKFYKIYFDSES